MEYEALQEAYAEHACNKTGTEYLFVMVLFRSLYLGRSRLDFDKGIDTGSRKEVWFLRRVSNLVVSSAVALRRFDVIVIVLVDYSCFY